MCCTEYPSTSVYLESQTTLRDRIIALDVLIDKTILLMADTVGGAGGNISAYELNDGQVNIKTTYRSIGDVEAGLKALERMKQLYINKLNGRATVLRDNRTFCR